MFTGLIQATGVLTELGSQRLQVIAPRTALGLFQDLDLGDSVAVDGVCLTVVEVLADGFVAEVSPETLQRTTLGQASQSASLVNLETSLRVGAKVGGHFVTGHIDGVGYLQTVTATDNAWELSFAVPNPAIARYIVPKGSIAVNGVSLTIAACDATGQWFKVAVIPHTFATTNLHQLQPNQQVNLEGDILGKYVEKFLSLGALSHNTNAVSNEILTDELTLSAEQISPAFLTEHGYL